MRLAILSAVVALAACGPHLYGVPTLTGADGTKWIPVHCSDHVQCLSKAAFFCPAGYRLSEREAHAGEAFTLVGRLGEGHTTYDETMLVQCNSCEVTDRYLVKDDGTLGDAPESSSTIELCTAASGDSEPAPARAATVTPTPTPGPTSAPTLAADPFQ